MAETMTQKTREQLKRIYKVLGGAAMSTLVALAGTTAVTRGDVLRNALPDGPPNTNVEEAQPTPADYGVGTDFNFVEDGAATLVETYQAMEVNAESADLPQPVVPLGLDTLVDTVPESGMPAIEPIDGMVESAPANADEEMPYIQPGD